MRLPDYGLVNASNGPNGNDKTNSYCITGWGFS